MGDKYRQANAQRLERLRAQCPTWVAAQQTTLPQEQWIIGESDGGFVVYSGHVYGVKVAVRGDQEVGRGDWDDCYAALAGLSPNLAQAA